MKSILNDRDFMECSLNWPRWPTLPLVKRDIYANNEEACGFIYSFSAEPKPIIYFGNVFRINEIAEKIKKETGKDKITWQEILATMKSREFGSLEEILEIYRID